MDHAYFEDKKKAIREEQAEAELNPPFETIQKFFRDGWDMIEIKKGSHNFFEWTVVINEGEICSGRNTFLSTCERDSQIAYDTFLPIYKDSK